jgi:hypothetical protein
MVTTDPEKKRLLREHKRALEFGDPVLHELNGNPQFNTAFRQSCVRERRCFSSSRFMLPEFNNRASFRKYLKSYE